MLVGRNPERARIHRLLVDAANGRSGALVVRGEAGIGKSVLLDDAASTAGTMRVLRGTGIESEAELPFGVLHQLLLPFLDRLDTLPVPQAAALSAAFGLVEGPDTNRFLIGAGTLTLLAELADDEPLLCLIDDAQWLDQGSLDALLFAARRFQTDPVAMVFAVRDTAVPFGTPGIDTLRLTGLPRSASAALLDERSPGLSAPARERVLDEAHGNPLALIELGAAQGLGHADPTEQVAPLPVTGRVQEAFRAQIAGLPGATRALLLTAAADAGGDLDLILRVGRTLGATAVDLAPAEHAHLVTLSTSRLVFRHPLVRAAAYQSAPHHQRIAVHRAFAHELALAGDVGADRRAWHLAAATTGPDESVAAELERTALRAQHRGGAMAVSAAYDRAGRLSTDNERKARRLGKAAQAAYDAGKPDRAVRLAAEVASLTEDPSILADALSLRAQVEYERTSPAVDATLALDAAELVPRGDPERAVLILTEAVCAGRNSCRLDVVAHGVRRLRALRLPPDSGLWSVVEAQIGWGEMFAGRPGRAVGPMAAHLRAARAGPLDHLHRIIAGFSGLMLGDDEATIAVMSATLTDARATGALTWIPYSLEVLALGHLMRGRFVDADASVAEGVPMAEELAMDTELLVLKAVSVWLAGVRGDERGCRSLTEEVLPRLDTRHPLGAALARWGLGLLDLAAGRCDDALRTLEDVCAGPAGRDVVVRAVPDLVEAAVRTGDTDRVLDRLADFDHWAEHVDSPVALALSLRCRALLATGDTAEEHFSAALRLQHAHAGPFDLARTRLLYGEWLRRRRRRGDAHSHLAPALTAFERLEALGWAERARTELAALGERPVARPQAKNPLQRLTPQEVQVVRLAASGYSNKEIGAQLFLSPRTVGHHLYKAYPKLGVSRRTELARLEL
ncbi:regulatory protein, luxR family [Amycolatopsis arida]|uniref:Regulatory protein, luxR family n=1 Tax=Amycolatopsis arida TaxID=587909 RepID=A0A1I5LB28_9PSEU|nr:LuxR family transcriptional regulator [Amycolatopsis arida]TDX93659.1 regulatory LuxR family protein [Amycolatopsis arida]SFO94574.1 regulatory protein, luxR family [Amycolatopsis arida]